VVHELFGVTWFADAPRRCCLNEGQNAVSSAHLSYYYRYLVVHSTTANLAIHENAAAMRSNVSYYFANDSLCCAANLTNVIDSGTKKIAWKSSAGAESRNCGCVG